MPDQGTALARAEAVKPVDRTLRKSMWRRSLQGLRVGLRYETRRGEADTRARVPVMDRASLPTPDQRKELSAYLVGLRLALRPSDADDLGRARAIALLYATLQSDVPSPELVALREEGWSMALGDRPALEVEEAAAMWLRGDAVEEGENRLFVPRPPELLRLADIARERIEVELKTVGAILAAVPADEPAP